MRYFAKILGVWLGLVALFLLSLAIASIHIELKDFVINSIHLLGAIVCASIVRHELSSKNRFIFINFLCFFSLSLGFHLSNFVGAVVLRDVSPFFVTQYLMIAYYSLLAFSIVYLTVDLMFRTSRTVAKYGVALVVVGGFFVMYFFPYVTDSKFLYNTQEIKTWSVLDDPFVEYEETFGKAPSPEYLAASTELSVVNEDQTIKTLSYEEKLLQVQALYPYLFEENFTVLILQPLYLSSIKMCVVMVGFIFLFFGYQYLKDPPQGAYIEKIMFALLVFSAIEIQNAWGFINAVESETLLAFIKISQYISIVVLAVIVTLLTLRLKFITSPNGEFYESELAHRPSRVTRWRDSLDNMLVLHFTQQRSLFRRIFVAESRNISRMQRD